MAQVQMRGGVSPFSSGAEVGMVRLLTAQMRGGVAQLVPAQMCDRVCPFPPILREGASSEEAARLNRAEASVRNIPSNGNFAGAPAARIAR